jgi:hypothetical protein
VAHVDPVLRALCRDQAPWAQVQIIASRQGRAIHVQQLAACGLSAQTIKTAAERGQLHPVHRGVRAVGIRRLSAHGARWAAFLAAGPDTAFTGRTGGAMQGIVRSSRTIQLVAPAKRRNHRGVVVRRAADLSPRWIGRNGGLPVLRPAHLLLDLAVELRAEELTLALNEALALNLLSTADVEAVIDLRPRHRGRRGLAVAISAATEDPGKGRTQGELEAIVLPLLRALPGLPPYSRNQLVELAGGRIAKADAFFPDARVLLELDSRTWHEQRRAMDSDRRRDQQALAAGFITFRITWRHATREWPSVSADLLATLERGSRARPGNEAAA